jgi:hypothetical protein
VFFGVGISSFFVLDLGALSSSCSFSAAPRLVCSLPRLAVGTQKALSGPNPKPNTARESPSMQIRSWYRPSCECKAYGLV